MKTICMGSRESKLAVAQSQILIDHLREYHPGIEIRLLTMKTTGDRILDQSLDKIGGKGLFVKELDLALTEGRIDLAVHSLKDMPMETPQGLPIVAFSRREDPRDALILPKGGKEINRQLPIGCSSRRRVLQMKKMFPDAKFQDVRGNVLTRLEKLDRGEYGALILAVAGLKRLGLEDRISRIFTTEEIIPAAGQGILAVQGRDGADYSFLASFGDDDATCAAICERAFVKALDGGCSSPVAAYAKVQAGKLDVTGLYYDEASGAYITGRRTGNMKEAEELGRELAKELAAEWSRK